MSGNPVNQVFQCTMQTDFPASVLSSNDAVGTLNDMPSVALNDTIGATFSLDFFLDRGLNITASSVTNASWVNYGGKAALKYTLNTTSDPITASQIEGAILLGGAALATAIIVGGLLAGVAPGLILLGLFITGVLTFIVVIVVAIGGVASTGAGQILLLLGGVAAVAIIGYASYKYLSDKELRRTVNRATGRVYGASKRVVGAVSSMV